AMREEGASPLEQSSRGEPCKTPAAISSAGARVSRTGPGRWLGSLPRIDALAGRIGSHQIGALGAGHSHVGAEATAALMAAAGGLVLNSSIVEGLALQEWWAARLESPQMAGTACS